MDGSDDDDDVKWSRMNDFLFEYRGLWWLSFDEHHNNGPFVSVYVDKYANFHTVHVSFYLADVPVTLSRASRVLVQNDLTTMTTTVE